MQRLYEQMYEQYRNKKSREAFIQLLMQWGATVHLIIYTYIILYMKKISSLILRLIVIRCTLKSEKYNNVFGHSATLSFFLILT